MVAKGNRQEKKSVQNEGSPTPKKKIRMGASGKKTGVVRQLLGDASQKTTNNFGSTQAQVQESEGPALTEEKQTGERMLLKKETKAGQSGI